jgi:hypothetical protein
MLVEKRKKTSNGGAKCKSMNNVNIIFFQKNKEVRYFLFIRNDVVFKEHDLVVIHFTKDELEYHSNIHEHYMSIQGIIINYDEDYLALIIDEKFTIPNYINGSWFEFEGIYEIIQ